MQLTAVKRKGSVMRKALALGLCALMVGMTPAGLVAAVSPAGTISGVARDMRGGHLVNASLRVRSANRGDVVSQVRTGAGGLFSVPGLQPGSYIVEAYGESGQVIGV